MKSQIVCIEFSYRKRDILIPESTTKISIEHLGGNRSLHVHKDESAFGNFTYIKPQDKTVEYRFESSAATLCFIRRTGKIAIHGSLVEYDRKWFEIPQFVEYQILPQTDTVMLTILKPIEIQMEIHSGGNIHDTHSLPYSRVSARRFGIRASAGSRYCATFIARY